MKKYVFLTCNIHIIGGIQTYLAGKAKFLESAGWTVDMFFSGRSNSGGCAFKSLERYTAGWFPEISIPPGNWPAFIRNSVLRDMQRQLGVIDGEIIIESEDSAHALWGELLAKTVSGKHISFINGEHLFGKRMFYAEYLDFFDFKHRRREFAGGSNSMSVLFAGYKPVLPEENYVFIPASEGPVQDVENEKVTAISKIGWNICYIGRIEKGYVPNILKGVHDFAQAHFEETVQMIFVGDVKKRLAQIQNMFSDISNINLVFLGDCVPIPRALYSKVDVVIGGSDCAIRSAQEGALTIIADAGNFMANGVLGIDTYDAHSHEVGGVVQMDFKTALEKVLVKKEYANKQIGELPRSKPCEFYYREHFNLIENSEKKPEYYDVIKNRKFSHKPSWIYYRCEWMVKILYRKYVLSRKKR